MEFKHRDDIPFFLNEEGLLGYGAEVGVFRGEYSELFLKNWHGERMYLVDAWKHLPDMVDISNHTDESHEKNFLDTTYRVAPYKDKVSIIRQFSEDAARRFPDEYFDFVYLDAGHRYKDVLVDLKSWYPKVKVNGYIMGHDYLDCTVWESSLMPTIFEVQSAVNSFALINNLSITVIPDNHYPSWCMKKIEA
jgi:hypothetical protein